MPQRGNTLSEDEIGKLLRRFELWDQERRMWTGQVNAAGASAREARRRLYQSDQAGCALLVAFAVACEDQRRANTP